MSILSCAHNRVFPELMKLLADKGGADIPVLGGGIIPDADIPSLKSCGVKEVFTPGSRLESIRDCLRAGLPAPMATCSADGTPHISHISQVEYLDRERVATSRQSFNRTLPHLQAKTIKPLAVTSAKATDILPGVPALAEAGLKDYEAELWYVVIAPPGLPPMLVQKINADIVKIVKSPEMQKKLAEQGARPVGSTPAEAAAFMKAESDKWGKVIKEANIKGE